MITIKKYIVLSSFYLKMEDIENQIKNYQTKIADLNKKYKENSNNSSEQLIINKQIIENYTFIDTY